MTPAQRRLLESADPKTGKLPGTPHRTTLRACQDRKWVESRRNELTQVWDGYFVTREGVRTLKETP